MFSTITVFKCKSWVVFDVAIDDLVQWCDYGDVGNALDIAKVYEKFSEETYSAMISEFTDDELAVHNEYQKLVKLGDAGISKVVIISLGSRQAQMWGSGQLSRRPGSLRDFYSDVTRQLLVALKSTDMVASKEFKGIEARFRKFNRIYSQFKSDRPIITDEYSIGAQMRKLFSLASPTYMPILPIVRFNDLPYTPDDSNDQVFESIRKDLRSAGPSSDLVKQLNMSLELIDGFVDGVSGTNKFPMSKIWFSVPGWYFDVLETGEFFRQKSVVTNVTSLRADVEKTLRNLVLM